MRSLIACDNELTASVVNNFYGCEIEVSPIKMRPEGVEDVLPDRQ
jgi:hypothetical protein